MNGSENQRKPAQGAERILVFIPAYNCAKQITRVLAQFDGIERHFAEVLVVDNRSPDNTLEAARARRRVGARSEGIQPTLPSARLGCGSLLDQRRSAGGELCSA